MDSTCPQQAGHSLREFLDDFGKRMETARSAGNFSSLILVDVLVLIPRNLNVCGSKFQKQTVQK